MSNNDMTNLPTSVNNLAKSVDKLIINGSGYYNEMELTETIQIKLEKCQAKALDIYKQLLQCEYPDPMYNVYAAACCFYMGYLQEAETIALKGPKCSLQTRILLHCAHRQGDEAKLMKYHQQLGDSLEERLTLAAIHFHRSHFQEATEIYKKVLLDNRDYVALNVYIALCYSKLDYYDVSLEILQMYLQQQPDSPLAVNLKACILFRSYNGKAAEAELKTLLNKGYGEHVTNDLIKHNMVVFNNGDQALQVLPQLQEVALEACLNLAIYHLRRDELQEAQKLIKDIDPQSPQEYIIKAIVCASIGQKNNDQKLLSTAQQYYQLVGASASECDTIPGRQCMASCFFLLKQFEDVLIFLQSIKSYFHSDDDFNWNYGITLANNGSYKEAEEVLTSIKDDKYKAEYCYVSWLARCFIMNGNARKAWDLYLRMDSSDESYQLLQLIANECYRVGSFFYAAKAFDVLERLDPNPEFWEGKRGACIGCFQMIIAKKEPRDNLRELVAMLRNTSSPQVEFIIQIIRNWAAENHERVSM